MGREHQVGEAYHLTVAYQSIWSHTNQFDIHHAILLPPISSPKDHQSVSRNTNKPVLLESTYGRLLTFISSLLQLECSQIGLQAVSESLGFHVTFNHI